MPSTILGTQQDDLLYGDTSGSLTGSVQGLDQMIDGLEGNDSVVGDGAGLFDGAHGGNDTLHGGPGNDRLVGDSSVPGGIHTIDMDGAVGGNDVLYGDAGNDLLYGDASGSGNNASQGGNDTLFGGDGDDALVGDAQVLNESHGGDDLLIGGSGADRLVGDAEELIHSSGGNDTLRGGHDARELIGDAHDLPFAVGGNDLLIADSGRDAGATLLGDGVRDRDSHLGDDTLYGGNGADRLIGDASDVAFTTHAGNDFLQAGDGNDALYGDAVTYFLFTGTGGADTLNGGRGDDQLWGGPGDDKFEFDRHSGHDVINDFNQGNTQAGIAGPEHDLIDLRAYNIDNLNSLQITDVGSDAVIHLTQHDSITVVGAAGHLTSDDFLFHS